MSARGRPDAAARDPVGAVIARAFREDRAAILATLIAHVGGVGLAEDALQDAFADAVPAWRRDGVPDAPRAWLRTASRRRAIDRLRRDRSLADRTERLAELVRLDRQEHRPVTEQSAIPDERLRPIFTCCHPAFDVPARVALTLRMLGGLSTGEIARAFLVSEPTMGKRIVRAKRKIEAAGIPYAIPADAETSRPAAGRPAGPLPDLQRGLLGQRRRRARPSRAVR